LRAVLGADATEILQARDGIPPAHMGRMKTGGTVLGCLFPFVLSLLACTSAPEPSQDTSEARVTATDGTCKAGQTIASPQTRWDHRSYFVKPARVLPASFAGKALDVDLRGAAEQAFALAPVGEIGRTIAREDYSICGNTLKLSAKPHVEFWALEECAAGPESACAVVKRYCIDGTFKWTNRVARCELKAGVALEARVFPAEERCDDGIGFSPWDVIGMTPLKRSEAKTHSPAGYSLDAGIALDSEKQEVRLQATKAGDPAGGVRSLSPSSWDACGSTITIKSQARIELEGEGNDQVSARFCKPGTIALMNGDSNVSCELQAGFSVYAEVFERDMSAGPVE